MFKNHHIERKKNVVMLPQKDHTLVISYKMNCKLTTDLPKLWISHGREVRLKHKV